MWIKYHNIYFPFLSSLDTLPFSIVMTRPPMASTQPGGDQTRVLVKWPDGSKSSVPRADYASYQSLGAEAVTA